MVDTTYLLTLRWNLHMNRKEEKKRKRERKEKSTRKRKKNIEMQSYKQLCRAITKYESITVEYEKGNKITYEIPSQIPIFVKPSILVKNMSS